jgi:radical SAM superfamily enzyme YgiQ (UPF0313 family)
MHITIIHPAIGHRRGERYIKTWQMEPLPSAVIAGLTPADVSVSFFDDRMEVIDFDIDTDAVVMSVETYTARRAYQIASRFRRRKIPIIMGGFHASLMTTEVARYAEAVVSGEAELVWPELIDDLKHGRLKKHYRSEAQPDLGLIRVNREIFNGKRYLGVGLVETGRGCRFPCEFCAIQSFFSRTHPSRPVDQIVAEISSIKHRNKLFFFVDDNFAGNIKRAKIILRALIPLKIRWVTQMSINATHDEEFIELLQRSGCVGVLIGFESLDPKNLLAMNKRFNTMKGGYEVALANLRKHNIRIYGTFMFGYKYDSPDSFDEAVDFAIANNFYIAAFNHLTPFPGTPLYSRLQAEGKLIYDAWWLDERYHYNDIPFLPESMSGQQLSDSCVEARRRFYSWKSIFKRGVSPVNRADFFMFRNFFTINAMHQVDVSSRNGYPLGDETMTFELIEATQ